ncbi:alpha-1,2-mannosyltransferase Mnn2p [[Candida] anglica]|uniref:Alpha-1,2-mannosyltransferase Mnn2p n=1 Tax=[Candida] anglica TaxID=148631 RepID=A0ABP0EQA7_9ASCO
MPILRKIQKPRRIGVLLLISSFITGLYWILSVSSRPHIFGDLVQHGYTISEYAHDVNNRFMIIQKHFGSHLAPKDENINIFWRFLNSEGSERVNYDVHFVDGYDYDDMLKAQKTLIGDRMKYSDSDRLKMETNFCKEFQTFLANLLKSIQECKPRIDSINNNEHYPNQENSKYPTREGRAPLYGGHLRENYLQEPVRTEEMLSSYLHLTEEELNSLKSSHDSFLSIMPQEFPQELFNNSLHNNFMKGDGIMYLGGGRYNQLVLLSLKTLRDSGSELPVEVILPQRSDYDIGFCQNILPSFNAECKVMTDYLPLEYVDKIAGYQLKNVALIISSFERVLYLDADNLPIKNPDVFFSNPPFSSQEMVIWPDLWRRSTSPYFYKIAGIHVDPKNKTRNSYFHDDPKGKSDLTFSYHDCEGAIPEASSETGQILINKKVHFRTLVLSMFYNYFGPEYYYPLLSQGAAGEGDKETFIAAAHKLKLPYYQVQEFTREFGPPSKNSNQHQFFAMGQYDPIVDFIQKENIKDKGIRGSSTMNHYSDSEPVLATNEYDLGKSNYKYHLFKSSQLFFLHANWPKLNPEELFLSNAYGRGPIQDGIRIRLYQNDVIKELNGYDFELQIMENLHWLYCEHDLDLNGLAPPNSPKRQEICIQIQNEVQFLSKDNFRS